MVVKRLSALVIALFLAAAPQAQEASWYIKAHLDEACSCPLFCPCYFAHPAADHCNFNIVYNVEQGHFGSARLDGLKVWLSGNLSENFRDGTAEAVIAAFEPTATQAQIDGFMQIATRIYPVKWDKVVVTDRTPIHTTHADGKHTATRGDKMGHLELVLPAESSGDHKTAPVVGNLNYFAAAKNTGFKLYFGTHHYTGHGYKYKYEQRNGFTIDIEAGTPPAKKTASP